MQKSHVTVGVDGSVYRFHPTFKQLLDQKIDQLINPGLEVDSIVAETFSNLAGRQRFSSLQFQLMLSEDGSGRGAALVAAVACRVEQEKLERKLQQQRME